MVDTHPGSTLKVDFKVKFAPSYKVGYIIRYGGYAKRDTWRAEIAQLERWARKSKLRSGKRIMYFIDKWGEKPQNQRRSVAAVEIKGKAKPEGKIQIMKIPRQRVVSVTFDPDHVSADIVYYGIEGWLESSQYAQTGRSRELYDGNPWSDREAWANCEVQVPIKRK
jgi:effector-binding domain-containing protein